MSEIKLQIDKIIQRDGIHLKEAKIWIHQNM